MTKKLIINADDFGLSQSINEGILVGIQKKIIRSVSLFANAPKTHDAVEIVKACPDVDIGVHLTLTQTRATSSPEKIPSLITKEGAFVPNIQALAKKMFFDQLDFQEIYKEFERQIVKISGSGINVSHLDTNQHVHLHPKIFYIVLSLAKKYNIKYVRIPCETPRSLKDYLGTNNFIKSIMSINKWFYVRLLKKNKLESTKHFAGLYCAGRLNLSCLLDILSYVKDGVTELCCHPGWDDNEVASGYGGSFQGYGWAQELTALLSDDFQRALKERMIELTNFTDMK